MDLYNELADKIKLLETSIKQLAKTGSDYAKAYTDYRIALSKRLVELKEQKMSATLSYDVARGEPNIAHLKFEEICKEAIYKANQESINATKLEIKIIQEQINKEYGNQTN